MASTFVPPSAGPPVPVCSGLKWPGCDGLKRPGLVRGGLVAWRFDVARVVRACPAGSTPQTLETSSCSEEDPRDCGADYGT